jgi:hypothetical protein
MNNGSRISRFQIQSSETLNKDMCRHPGSTRIYMGKIPDVEWYVKPEALAPQGIIRG